MSNRLANNFQFIDVGRNDRGGWAAAVGGRDLHLHGGTVCGVMHGDVAHDAEIDDRDDRDLGVWHLA